MESHQKDSTETKTHDEIMRLFKDLDSIEAKVKNSELFEKDINNTETSLQEIEPQVKKPEVPSEETSQLEPPGEMLPEAEEKQRRLFWRKKEKQERPSEPKTDNQPEEETSTELETPIPEIKIPRSTFTLQLDAEGNLAGLPLKKIKSEKQEEEQVKGLNGKLRHIGSLLRRENASEAESKIGIGDKIKGIFRRKSKE